MSPSFTPFILRKKATQNPTIINSIFNFFSIPKEANHKLIQTIIFFTLIKMYFTLIKMYFNKIYGGTTKCLQKNLLLLKSTC